MAIDLSVAQGTSVVLDENPPAALAGSIQQVQIRALNDLVDLGLVSSREELNQLLDSAKKVTAETLTRRETFVPFVRIHGTTRPDLRRFGSFMAVAPEVSPSASRGFWRAVRGIDPQRLATVTLDMDLRSVINPASRRIISGLYNYFFRDITVEPGAVLKVGANVQTLMCNDMLIKKTGRIIVEGSGVVIKASSIKGEQ